MAVSKRSYMDILLGLFVAFGLGLLIAFVFLLGQEKRIFDSTMLIRAQFPNVAGLREGAEVLLGGVAIGNVSDIQFPPLLSGDKEGKTKANLDIKDDPYRLITVWMRITASKMDWIKEDSIAQIDSEGLLGNRIINITLGSPEAKPPKDALLKSAGPSGLNDAMVAAKNAALRIGDFFEALNAAGADKGLAQSLGTFANIMKEVEQGNGIVHRIIYDKKSGANFAEGLASVTKTLESIRSTASHIDSVMGEVETGKGALHSLIYDEEGAKVIGNLASLLKEVETLAVNIRTGSGLLHSVIYEDDNGRLMENLNSVASDLQQIVSKVRGGEGTLGRLVVDPTVFEDLKLIVSEVKRNKLLKTLIRFGISLNETPNS